MAQTAIINLRKRAKSVTAPEGGTDSIGVMVVFEFADSTICVVADSMGTSISVFQNLGQKMPRLAKTGFLF